MDAFTEDPHLIQRQPNVEIGMLIGRNMPSAFQPLQIIYGNDDEPWAEQYKFGWTIIGPVSLDNRGSENCATVNCITIQRGDLLNFQLANRYQLLRKTCSLFHHKELFERLDFTTANQTDDAAGLL